MQPDKWVEGIDPAASPAEAARLSLEQRLKAVWRFLPLAAHHAEDDVEHVHALRVATRRSLAGLRLFAPMLPTKRTKALIRDLRRIREAAGEARDLDVMLARHNQDSGSQGRRLLKDLQRRRAKAQGPIIGECKRLSRDDLFPRRVDELLGRVRLRAVADSRLRFDDWARSRLREIVADFFEAQPTNATDLEALHRFRIRAKRLRYAMELLAPAFPAVFREELYPLVEQLQEHLGEINDHAVALGRFERWADHAPRGMKAEYGQDLLAREHEELDRALDRFRGWWDQAHRSDLSEGFGLILGRYRAAV